MIFGNEKRNEVKQQNPDAPLGGIAKILGKMWSEMKEEEKAKYKEEATKLREEFKKANPKAPTPKPKPKKTSKTSKKKKQGEDEEGTESENEESSDEEPLAKKKKGDIEQNIKDEIIVILKEGDLDTLSVKKIRAQLKEKFGEDPVREHKSMIKDFINAELEKL